MRVSSELVNQICQHTSRKAPPGVDALCEEILETHGDAALAILFYGSCLRKGDDRDGIVDLYLIVKSYHAANQSHIQALLNRLLPPNVFYLEVPFEGRIVRAKYAILTLSDLERGLSMDCFHSYFWARFAQPVALVYGRDAQISERVNRALAQGTTTFVSRVLPELTSPFTARDLWRQGFVLSYQAELRPEGSDDVARLYDAEAKYYEQVTRSAMASVTFEVQVLDNADPVRYRASMPGRVRHLSRLAWGVRCLQGKVLSFLRLFKALFTFQGGVDYVLWKIERHSGVTVEAAPPLRRRSILGVCALFWRLYRQGGFR
jgi:hypothetical protein